jgi:hypothetical protein
MYWISCLCFEKHFKGFSNMPFDKREMNATVSLHGVLRTALEGVSCGYERFEEAAKAVQRAVTELGHGDRVIFSQDARALGALRKQIEGEANPPFSDDRPSLARGMIDMRLARYAVLANLATMSTSNDMLDEAVNIATARATG